MVRTPVFGSEGPRLNLRQQSTSCAAVIALVQTVTYKLMEVYFHCLPSRLLDETLNRDSESIASMVLAC